MNCIRTRAASAFVLLLLFCLGLSACGPRRQAARPEPVGEGFAYWSCLANDTVYSPLPLADIRRNADAGNPAAMTVLGDLAATKEMFEPAVYWFMRAADAGHAPAYLPAGEYLPDAPGLAAQPENTALAYLRNAAEYGADRAPFLYLQRSLRAGAALSEQDISRWAPHVLEADDPDDMYSLWSLVSQPGHSRLRSAFLSVVRQYASRAGNGEAKAAWVMYLLHDKGIAVAHAPSRATGYLDKAARAGSPEALFQLYAQSPDNTESLLASAQKDYIPALLKAGEEYGVGKETLPRDREKAKQLFGRAAALGNTRGTFLLGLLWTAEANSGVPGASEEALRWYTTAAEMGSPDAFRKLYASYEHGLGTRPDKAKAAYWSRIAQSTANPVPKNLEYLLLPEGREKSQ